MSRRHYAALMMILGIVSHPLPAQGRWYHGFMFDAKLGCGPIPVGKDTFNLLANNRLTYERCPEVPQRPWQFEDREGIPMVILHASFLTDYSATSAQISRGSGVIEVRGGPASAPASLTSSTPDTKGGRVISAVTVLPITQAQFEAQLLDPSQMSVPQITLEAQAAELDAASISFRQDVADFVGEIGRVQNGSGGGCESAVTTPHALRDCIKAARGQIEGNNQCLEGKTTCGSAVQFCSAGTPAIWNTLTFSCALRVIDARINDLKRLRARLNEYSFGSASQRITVNAATLIAKLTVFRDNLSAAQAAASHVNTIYGLNLSGSSMKVVRKAELKRQVTERYGTSTNEAERNRQVSMREGSGEFERYMNDLRGVIADLCLYAADRRNELEKPFHPVSPCSGTRRGQVLTHPDLESIVHVRETATHVRNQFDALTAVVDTVNGTMAQLFDSINVVHIQRREPDAKVIALDLRTGAGTNRSVLTSLTSTDHYIPYRFDVPGDAPSAPISAAADGRIIGASPNGAIVLTTSNVTPAISRTFDFELHRMWNATITGGFVVSGVGQVSYATLASGDPQRDSIILVSERSYPVHYVVGLAWFPGKEDTYPDTHWAFENRTALMIGAAVDQPSNFYAGVLVEPRSGINVAGGVHWGPQVQLKDTYNKGSLVNKGVPVPIIERMKASWYFMAGLDLNIFRSVFGGTPSVPR